LNDAAGDRAWTEYDTLGERKAELQRHLERAAASVGVLQTCGRTNGELAISIVLAAYLMHLGYVDVPFVEVNLDVSSISVHGGD
jgi:hypothetical protein